MDNHRNMWGTNLNFQLTEQEFLAFAEEDDISLNLS